MITIDGENAGQGGKEDRRRMGVYNKHDEKFWLGNMDDIEGIRRILSKANILKVGDIDKIAHTIYKGVYSKYDTNTIINNIKNNRDIIGIAPYIYKTLMGDIL